MGSSAMRSTRHAARLVLAAALACAACQGGNTYRASIPFEYPSRGAGPHAFRDVVVLSEGAEARVVSAAIVEVLQGLQFSVLTPPISGNAGIAPGQRWKTDVVSLPHDVVEAHNREAAGLVLPLDRYYSVEHEGTFTIEGSQIVLEVSSTLYARGALGSPSLYRGEYSSTFFGNRLKRLIHERLLRPRTG
jgi:hypothetical protein